MSCRACGNDLRAGARFCPACGAPARVAEPEVTVPAGKGLQRVWEAPDTGTVTDKDGRPRPAPAAWIVAGGVLVLLALMGAVLVVLNAGGKEEEATTTTVAARPATAPATTAPAEGATEATPSSPTAPAPVDRDEQARREIERLAATGADRVGSGMLDRWIPQISSKQVGLEADGIVYDNQAILDHFTELRQRFGDLVVINSSDFSSFELDGWYVALAPQSFGTSEEALGWCASNGMPTRDACFAKFVSRTVPYTPGTTDYP